MYMYHTKNWYLNDLDLEKITASNKVPIGRLILCHEKEGRTKPREENLKKERLQDPL